MTKLRETRIRAGLTMTGFALKAGVEPSLVSLIERGKRPSQETARRIACALGTEPEAFWPNYPELRAR